MIADNRQKTFSLTQKQVAQLCDRRFGIGADGLMLLENHPEYDFKMVYYNADGHESSMCGNGGRCLVAFAKRLGIIKEQANFIAIDGAHRATIVRNEQVELGMRDVENILITDENIVVLNTGSPHYVSFESDVKTLDVYEKGKSIRNSESYFKEGINVNFVVKKSDHLFVRTYERGVEDETLSCGTGVTASAIASVGQRLGRFKIKVETLGGMLEIHFEKTTKNSAKNVLLCGPATFVFDGEIKC